MLGIRLIVFGASVCVCVLAACDWLGDLIDAYGIRIRITCADPYRRNNNLRIEQVKTFYFDTCIFRCKVRDLYNKPLMLLGPFRNCSEWLIHIYFLGFYGIIGQLCCQVKKKFGWERNERRKTNGAAFFCIDTYLLICHMVEGTLEYFHFFSIIIYLSSWFEVSLRSSKFVCGQEAVLLQQPFRHPKMFLLHFCTAIWWCHLSSPTVQLQYNVLMQGDGVRFN